jgi:quaternary ammonium compound-resistance protein SugE
MTLAWACLFIASCLEVCWIYTLKVLDMKKIAMIKPATLFTGLESWKTLLPLIGYIVFGLSNVIAISKAMKTIPAGTAFAVWMGLALVATKAIDILYLKQPYNLQQLVFTLLVLIGIVGLRWYEV